MPEEGLSLGSLTDVTIRETSPPPDRTADPVLQLEGAADDQFLQSSGGFGAFNEVGIAGSPAIVSAFPTGDFTDNIMLRGHNDGGGGAIIQETGITVADNNDMSGIGIIICGSSAITIVSIVGNLLLSAFEQAGAANGQGMTWNGVDWVPDDVATAATSPIVLTGDTISHAVSGVAAATYTSVTVDVRGHVTAGTNPGHVTGSGIDNRIVLWNGVNAIDESSFSILLNQLLAPNGTAALPSIRVGTEESGFYRPLVNQIGLTITGINRVTFTGGAITPQAGVHITGQSGSLTNCAFSFFGDINTGLIRPANQELGLVINGTRKIHINATAVTMEDDITLGSGAVNLMAFMTLHARDADVGAASPAIKATHLFGPNTNIGVRTTTLAFVNGANRWAWWSVTLPEDYDGRAINCRMYFATPAGAGAGVVRWLIYARCYGDSDTLNENLGVNTTINHTVDIAEDHDVLSVSITPSASTRGNHMSFSIARNGVNAADTFGVSIHLYKVKFSYV